MLGEQLCFELGQAKNEVEQTGPLFETLRSADPDPIELQARDGRPTASLGISVASGS